jgi:hypothetical protein
MPAEKTLKGLFSVDGILCQDLLKIISLIPNKGIWAYQKIRLASVIDPLYQSFSKAYAEALNDFCDKDANGKPVTNKLSNGNVSFKFSTDTQKKDISNAIQNIRNELPISVSVKDNIPVKQALSALREILTGEQCPEIPEELLVSFAAVIEALDTALSE